MKRTGWTAQYMSCEYKGYSLTAFNASWNVWKYAKDKTCKLVAFGAADDMRHAKRLALAAVELMEDK
jgi:hypothetical protein